MKDNLEVPKDSTEGFLYKFKARCDWEDYFCIDEFELRLKTSSLAEAAKYAEQRNCSYTLWSIERID